VCEKEVSACVRRKAEACVCERKGNILSIAVYPLWFIRYGVSVAFIICCRLSVASSSSMSSCTL
jgi:hypothetical protein